MAIHGASEFTFLTGDDLAAVKYPADGETRPALPANALCGYDLACLEESVLWRYENNPLNATPQTTWQFFKSVAAGVFSNLRVALNSVVDSDYSRALVSSAVSAKTVASFGDTATFADFKSAFPELLLDPSTLAYKSATPPSKGDRLTKTYLTALQDSVAAFYSVAYPVGNVSLDARTVLSASGSYNADQYDFWVTGAGSGLGGNFGHVSWVNYSQTYPDTNTDGTAEIGLADTTIFAQVSTPSASAPIEKIVAAVAVKVTNRVYKVYYDDDHKMGETVADVDEAYYAWLPLTFVRESAGSPNFVLRGSQFTLDGLRSLFGIELVDVKSGLSGYSYIGYQTIKVTIVGSPATVVQFKDL